MGYKTVSLNEGSQHKYLHGSVEGDVVQRVALVYEVVALWARVGVLEVLDDA